ncbi:MAG TPA: heavy metal translocating P-type ATPase metal-binding domain-containing protein [Blastocatellia bacterium]|nr:heavy metal translocating P-type ATPase metal-binding domain-containing protein [Blastocatellia bacterium]
MLTDTAPPGVRTLCFHCGEECDDDSVTAGGRAFCCTGCRTVYELLQESDLCAYYDIEAQAGVSFKKSRAGRFEYLDDEAVRRALIQYSDGIIAKTTFRLPQIHCTSCIWLLENLYRINPGVLRTEVNFLKKEIAVTFREREVSLREVVALLARLGYEPDIRLEHLDKATRQPADSGSRKLYLKVGLAGFAFGNVMLLSFPDYLDGSGALGAGFKTLFGWLSIALATPVLLYSASDYFVSSWYALRGRRISLEVPVALGILALYLRSVFDILGGTGTGYLDSFTGLVFFLLIGKLFQKKTFDSLSFDRNYASYFPLSVTTIEGGSERSVPVSKLSVGSRIFVRNRELVPADAVLLSPEARIDYSFVTGESEPVEVTGGAVVYAGGRVAGAGAELEVTKEVSHSYLTQLWNDEAFRKEKRSSLVDLSDAFGKYFTIIVGIIAAGAALYRLPDVDKAISVFTAVLIIACPCALTLAAPFTLGAAVAIFGKAKFYLKNVGVVPDLAALDAIVFDKTGTLTRSEQGDVRFDGAPLSDDERAVIAAVLKHSTHPLGRRILSSLGDARAADVAHFREVASRGVEAGAGGLAVALGSAAWIAERTGIMPPPDGKTSLVCLELNGTYRGGFRVGNAYRDGLDGLFAALAPERELYLLSGDNDHGRARLEPLFADARRLAFHQSPEDKLRFVKKLQDQGKVVGMIGDGLNDAGALKQSNVGIALAEDTGAFSPACDAILAADNLQRLPVYIGFARYALRVLLACFLVSLVYNAVGLTFAVTGRLSPLVTAIFMPVSSLSVIAIAWGAMKLREKEIVQ